MAKPDYSNEALCLQGRLQIETARDALALTGLNPAAEQGLQAFLDVQIEVAGEDSQGLLVVHKDGDEGLEIKADIVKSLEVLGLDPDSSPDTQVASTFLLELLRDK